MKCSFRATSLTERPLRSSSSALERRSPSIVSWSVRPVAALSLKSISRRERLSALAIADPDMGEPALAWINATVFFASEFASSGFFVDQRLTMLNLDTTISWNGGSPAADISLSNSFIARRPICLKSG